MTQDLVMQIDPPELTSFSNSEVRRARLLQLASGTSLKEVAARAEVSAQNLDHICKRRRQSTTRRDESGVPPVVVMGDAIARKIEAAHGKPLGWMDWPLLHVDFETFLGMGQTQRLLFQGRMQETLKEFSEQNGVVKMVDKTAVTNEKVHSHYRETPAPKTPDEGIKRPKTGARQS